MNTHPKNNNENGPGLVSHPDHVSANKRGSVYEQITERIVALLEKGTVPWRKPWKAQSGLPRNLVSKKAYRGINVLLLHAMSYESPFWLTFRQAMELGGNVRKGEKACPVVFWKQHEVEDKETGEKEKFPHDAVLLRFQCRAVRRTQKHPRASRNAFQPADQAGGDCRVHAEAAGNQTWHEEGILLAGGGYNRDARPGTV